MFERMREQPTVDARLVPYLEAQDEDAADRELGLIFSGHLERMINAAVQRQTGVNLKAWRRAETQAVDTAANLLGDVTISLMKQLRKMRAGKVEPIGSLEKFVRQTARNCFIEYLSERSPHRKKIRDGMYEYIERERNADGSVTAWWVGGNKVYGLAEHRDRAVEVNANYELLTQYPNEFKADFFSAQQLERWKLSNGGDAVKGVLMVELLQAILTAVGGPVKARHLEDAIVQMTGGDALGTVMNELEREDEETEDWWELGVASAEPTQEHDTLGAQTLPLVWQHICSLDVSQRRGCILKMRPEDLELYYANGISERQVADALGIPLEEFQRLRDTLPLNHREIERLFPGRARTIENAGSRAKKSLREKFGDWFGLKKRVEE